MKTFYGLCPFCGNVEAWSFHKTQISYPPTGGDYEWSEVGSYALCPVCNEEIAVRVKVDLATRQIQALVSSPIPAKEDWHCYVVAFVETYAADLVVVRVLLFAETEAIAQEQLRVNKVTSLWAEGPTILDLSHEGYKDLDGTLLHPSANEQIKYH